MNNALTFVIGLLLGLVIGYVAGAKMTENSNIRIDVPGFKMDLPRQGR